jgi:hypothetical protein
MRIRIHLRTFNALYLQRVLLVALYQSTLSYENRP